MTTTSTRHVTDFHGASQAINSLSGDWISAGTAEQAYKSNTPLEYFGADGKLAKTVEVRETPAGQKIGEHELDGSGMKIQILTTSYVDTFAAKSAKRKTA